MNLPVFINDGTATIHNETYNELPGESIMSEDQQLQSPSLWVNIEASASFDTADEALECLIELREVSFENIFTDRNTELDSEDGEGISITFYNENNRNSLRLSTDSDINLNIRLSLVDEYHSESPEIVNELLSFVSPIHIDEIIIYQIYEHPFRDLDLPITDESDFDVIGVRVKHQGADHIVQEDEDHTSVTSTFDLDEDISENVEASFVTEQIEIVDDLIQEVS